jgi:SAM-dependent methyltransferase
MTTDLMDNIDPRTVDGFGKEWAAFDQSHLVGDEYKDLFDAYFAVFPFESLPPGAEGFDLGCGSGRWAAGMAPKVGLLHCIDPASEALAVARRRLKDQTNVRFHQASTDTIPLPDSSQDFGYSLGVLHHIPDTARAMRDCVSKLKAGAPFLIYIYYAFDNRPTWFRGLWRISNVLRRGISRMPFAARRAVTTAIATLAYWPLARSARLAEQLGLDPRNMPLSAYRHRSFYTMRTDALDRFGTALENRFTRQEIRRMMEETGLEQICFHEGIPYWTACGVRSGS